MKRKSFFKDLKKEFNQIIWPSKEEVLNKTVLVVAVSFVLTLLIFALDSIYSYGLKEFLQNLM